MKNLAKIKKKFKHKPKPKVVLKDIQWAFANIDGSSKKQKDLDREYELRLGLNIERRDYQGFLVPSRTCKQIKEDKENLNQYESLVKNNIEETKIERLKKIDDFIQTSFEKLNNEPEDLEENEKLNTPLSQEELRNIEATSIIIDKYLSNEIKSYDDKYFKKKIGSDKQQYFDLYKGEYYLLQRAAIMDYSNIYNETKNFFL
jgi:GTPase Era involved in 16S rRNA processing